MKTTVKVYKLVWNFNKAIKNRSQSFINEHFFGIENILDGVYKGGWILGYKRHFSRKVVEIFLRYDNNNKSIITRVKCLHKPSLQHTIRLQQLVADSKNTAYTGIIRTAKMGFLTNRDALKNKIGGSYLVKFF